MGLFFRMFCTFGHFQLDRKPRLTVRRIVVFNGIVSEVMLHRTVIMSAINKWNTSISVGSENRS